MITVQVKLFATLRKLLPEQSLGEATPLELPENATIAGLAQRLKLPDNRMIFINGVAETNEDHALQADDEIAVFPLLGGG